AFPSRILLVRDETGGDLRVSIISEEDIHRLTQKADGSVVWVWGDFGETQKRSAANFATLYRENPELIERELLQVWQAYGFLTPPLSSSAEVQEALAELKRGREPAQRAAAQRLIAALDANQFADRQAAFRDLQETMLPNRETVEQALQSDELSAETKLRLRQLIEHDNVTCSEATVVARLVE
ncbi:MAG: hypothetical protein KDB23_19480, partial [Planctomycetales bacterium]|nr:hypothetical protein [Planctomycetales bacterium]